MKPREKPHTARAVFCMLSGALLIVYYLLAGCAGGFRTSALWVWLAGGAVIFSLGALELPRRMPRVLRRCCTALRIFVCVCAAAFFLVEGLVLSGMWARCPDGVDYLIVPGAKVNGEEPGRALRSRIDTAYAYLAANPDTKAILCGGQGEGESISEAECMRRALTAYGIGGERLILESRSRSTSENMRFAYALAGSPEASAGVATSNFHVYRSVRLAAACGWGEVYGLAAPFSGILLPHYMAREFLTITVDSLRKNM